MPHSTAGAQPESNPEASAEPKSKEPGPWPSRAKIGHDCLGEAWGREGQLGIPGHLCQKGYLTGTPGWLATASDTDGHAVVTECTLVCRECTGH